MTNYKKCPECGVEANSTNEIAKIFGWRYRHLLGKGPPQSRCSSCRNKPKKKRYTGSSPVANIDRFELKSIYQQAFPNDKASRSVNFMKMKLERKAKRDEAK